MMALSSIAASHPSRPRLMKINPLIENRIWVNCFESNQSIQNEARAAWRQVCGVEDDDELALPSPSKMYTAPLMPLLSHKDRSIANAAALAFAHAAGMHQDTAEKSVVQLCSTFIDAYPTLTLTRAVPEEAGVFLAWANPLASPRARRPFPNLPPPLPRNPNRSGSTQACPRSLRRKG